MLDRSYLIVCVFALIAMFGGGLIGLSVARALPEHHLTKESGAVVKLAAAIVASLTSLVLALMLSAANGAYSVNAGIVTKLGADIVQLDHLLRAYGPEASGARDSLRAYAEHKSEELFPANPPPRVDARVSADLLDRLADSIMSLDLPDRRHTALAGQALSLTNQIYAERWLLWENPGTTVPTPFLFVLIFWLFLVYLSFGVFAPPNLTVVASLFLSSLAVTGAIFLILQLGDPMHHSWLRISGEPLQRAMSEIGRP
ncbi:hypothetical protein [Reyranella sp.]|uniref:bestrophin-like domain n=1 Tax=Reyranella sp. TaxID=1929291 RepID=UPI003BA915CB